jgi:predicted dehydrogenase
MSEIVNYGIVGCGMMGQEHIRNIALLPHARVTSLYDPDALMLAASRAIAPDARVATSLKDLVTDPGIDCLLIASPNYQHVDQLEEIAGFRHLPILVEKPLYTKAEDAARLVAFEKSYGAPVWVAMEYRYMPPVAKFIEEARASTGGTRMLSIREHRFPFLPKVDDWNRFNRYTGGTLVEKCCHFFDLMRHILDDEPVRVMASAGQEINHRDERYDGEAPDIWDTAYVIVDFAGGQRAMLDLCMYADGSTYQEELAAMGPAAKVECFVPGPGRFWPTQLGDPPVANVIVSPREPKAPQSVRIPVDPALLDAGDHNGATYYQHARFHQVVRGEGTVDVTLTDGARAVAMGLAAQEAAVSGQTVTLGF